MERTLRKSVVVITVPTDNRLQVERLAIARAKSM
jgi:hypothetical protein